MSAHPMEHSLAAPVTIGAVALAVRDVARVARFYQEVVGLEPLGPVEGGLQLGAGGTPFLELLHRPDALPRDPQAAGLYHTAILLPERIDLGRWLAHAAALGVALDGAADHLVSEAVYLHDPEGNGVEIYADRPRATWNWSDGRVRMANQRLDMIGLRALATTPWTGAPTGTRIGHVHLQVGEIAAAKAFYAGLLGFDVTADWPQAVFMSTGGYHHHLACNVWESAGAGPRDPARAGLASVTLHATAAAADRLATRAGGADALLAGLRDPWGTRINLIAH